MCGGNAKERYVEVLCFRQFYRHFVFAEDGEENMPLEKGGRADKKGNQYEINYSIVIEALGVDEVGTDILVTTFEGIKEHQQCKARNASKKVGGFLT